MSGHTAKGRGILGFLTVTDNTFHRAQTRPQHRRHTWRIISTSIYLDICKLFNFSFIKIQRNTNFFPQLKYSLIFFLSLFLFIFNQKHCH